MILEVSDSLCSLKELMMYFYRQNINTYKVTDNTIQEIRFKWIMKSVITMNTDSYVRNNIWLLRRNWFWNGALKMSSIWSLEETEGAVKRVSDTTTSIREDVEAVAELSKANTGRWLGAWVWEIFSNKYIVLWQML